MIGTFHNKLVGTLCHEFVLLFLGADYICLPTAYIGTSKALLIDLLRRSLTTPSGNDIAGPQCILSSIIQTIVAGFK